MGTKTESNGRIPNLQQKVNVYTKELTKLPLKINIFRKVLNKVVL